MNKQIEEMAKIMQKCYEKNGVLNFKWFAESAYKCLTKNSVVLTKEEYEKLKNNQMPLDPVVLTMKQYLDINHKAYFKSKETAREIFNKLLKEVVKRKSCGNADVVIQELAKQYGVDLGEEQ